ncbi:RraA family protein, partial [Steroidobacter sp.]|uniref:RraA family protein n=1 Tax=Steroidobacter sp. TaxID=1978227 RepID=UPI001A39EA0E
PVYPALLSTSIGPGQLHSEGLIAAVDALPAGAILLLHSQDLPCAAWGDVTSTAASARGALGVVCTGYVRDSATLRRGQLPVFARGSLPARAMGRADVVLHGVKLKVCDIDVEPGDLLVADDDGVVIVPASMQSEVLERAAVLIRRESMLRAALANGTPLGTAVAKSSANTSATSTALDGDITQKPPTQETARDANR